MIFNRNSIQSLKERYPEGTRIELISMNDPLSPVPSGTKGTVSMVDDAGTIHMVWDNGRTLGIIPGEDNFRKLISEIETMKLYMPLSARVYGFNEVGETNDAYTGMSDRELIEFKSNIVAAIKNNELPEENERGLMQWYHDNDEVNKKVLSVRPSVEIIDGRLMGVMECSIKCVLNDAEIKKLKDYVSGQTSDGWGEGFEQRPIKTEEGEIYISFWNSAPGWKICTEKELQAQRQLFSEMSL